MDRVIEKKKWPAKRIALYSFIGFIVALLAYALFFADKSRKLHIESDRISIATVEKSVFQEWIPTNGIVVPLKTVYLDAIEGGQIEELFVEEGAFVEKGDPLIRLANTNLLLDIMYREAELFRQIDNLRNTRILIETRRLDLQGNLLNLDYQLEQQNRLVMRSEKLYESNLISEEEYLAATQQRDYLASRRDLTLETYEADSLFRKVQIDGLESSVNRMQSNLNIVSAKLDNLTIKATISGQLTALNAELGQSKSQGMRIGQIDDLNGFLLRCSIDEHYIARVTTGLEGRFNFASSEYRVSSFKVYPEVIGGRFEVDMAFLDGAPAGIRRGQTLRVKLELGQSDEALVVSRGGFYQSTGGQWIYVLNEAGNEAVRRDIRLGRQNTEVFEVLEGLVPGETVITSSYATFGDAEKLILN